MEKWYTKKEFGRIEHYVREETTRFLKVLQYLSRNKSRMGITLKEAHAARQAPLTQPPAERPAPASPPRPPAQPMRPATKAAATGKPVSRDRPAAKADSHTLLPAPERTLAKRKRSPPGRNQLAKHPSAKNAPVKKGPGKRR